MSARLFDSGPVSTIVFVAFAVLFFGLVFVVPAPILASEENDDDEKTLTGSQTSPQRVAASRVRVHDAQLTDVFTAGGEVEYDKVNADDVFVAGGSLRLREVNAEDVVIAGGEIHLQAQIGDDLLAAGGRVRLDPKTMISGDAIIAGGDVELAGKIDGNVTAAAGRIVLEGNIGGDVDLSAGRVEVGSTARIGGKLVYRSKDSARISEQAVIEGGVTHEATSVEPMSAWAIGGFGIALLLVALLSMGLLAAVLQAVIPQPIAGALTRFYTRPWASWLIGFGLVIAVPVAAKILMLTILGIPLAVLFFALYAVGLALGSITAAHELGRLVTRGDRVTPASPVVRRVVFRTALGMVLLVVLVLIPILGWLVLLAAVPAGVGAFAAEFWQRVRGSFTAQHDEQAQVPG